MIVIDVIWLLTLVKSEWSEKLERKRAKNKKLKSQLENNKRQFQQERIMLDSVINNLKEVNLNASYCLFLTCWFIFQERAKAAADLVQSKDKLFNYKRTNGQLETEKSQLIVSTFFNVCII